MLLIYIMSRMSMIYFHNTHRVCVCVLIYCGFILFILFVLLPEDFIQDPCRLRRFIFFVPSKMRSSCWRTPCGWTEPDAVITLFHSYSGFRFLSRSDGWINAWRLFHVESSRASYKTRPFTFFVHQNLFIKNQFKNVLLMVWNVQEHSEKCLSSNKQEHSPSNISESQNYL